LQKKRTAGSTKYIAVRSSVETPRNTYHCLANLLFFSGDPLNCTHNFSSITIATDITGINSVWGLDLEPDYINVSCSVDYRGNKAPVLLWNQEDGIPENRSEITNVSSRITYSLTMQVKNKMNGTRLSCHIQDVFHRNQTWTSPLINTLCKLRAILIT